MQNGDLVNPITVMAGIIIRTLSTSIFVFHNAILVSIDLVMKILQNLN